MTKLCGKEKRELRLWGDKRIQEIRRKCGEKGEEKEKGEIRLRKQHERGKTKTMSRDHI